MRPAYPPARLSPLAAAICGALLVPVASGGEPAPLLLTPESVDFGNVRIGQSSAPADILVTANPLFGPVSIDTLGSGSDAFVLTADQCSDVTLASGQSCSFAVTFAPEDDSKYLSNIAIEQTGGGEPTFLPVAGTGVAPLLSLTPTAIDFGTVPVGNGAEHAEVSLANTGSGLLTISGLDGPQPPFSIAGGSCPPPPIELAAEAQCTLLLSALVFQAGDYVQSVTVTSNSMTGDGTLHLSLESVNAAGANLVATPDYIDFGEVLINTGTTRTLNVANTGTAPASLGGLLGPDPPFTVVDDQCAPYPSVLQPGAHCDILVGFQPATIDVFFNSLIVLSDAENGLRTVNLAGRAGLPRIPGLRGHGMAALILLLTLVGAVAVRSRKRLLTRTRHA